MGKVYYFCQSRILRCNVQKNGREITWKHLVTLYERDRGKGSGLAMVPRLKFEHIHLSSFSKMRVDLAALVWYFKDH